MSKYYWNFDKDEEEWYHAEDTIAACIREAKEYNREIEKESYRFVFIGELENHVPYMDAISILESLEESAYDECGESSEGWLDAVSEEEKESLEEKLNTALQEWLKETNNQPSFGRLSEIYCYDMETGDEIKGPLFEEVE